MLKVRHLVINARGCDDPETAWDVLAFLQALDSLETLSLVVEAVEPEVKQRTALIGELLGPLDHIRRKYRTISARDNLLNGIRYMRETWSRPGNEHLGKLKIQYVKVARKRRPQYEFRAAGWKFRFSMTGFF